MNCTKQKVTCKIVLKILKFQKNIKLDECSITSVRIVVNENENKEFINLLKISITCQQLKKCLYKLLFGTQFERVRLEKQVKNCKQCYKFGIQRRYKIMD